MNKNFFKLDGDRSETKDDCQVVVVCGGESLGGGYLFGGGGGGVGGKKKVEKLCEVRVSKTTSVQVFLHRSRDEISSRRRREDEKKGKKPNEEIYRSSVVYVVLNIVEEVELMYHIFIILLLRILNICILFDSNMKTRKKGDDVTDRRERNRRLFNFLVSRSSKERLAKFFYVGSGGVSKPILETQEFLHNVFCSGPKVCEEEDKVIGLFLKKFGYEVVASSEKMRKKLVEMLKENGETCSVKEVVEKVKLMEKLSRLYEVNLMKIFQITDESDHSVLEILEFLDNCESKVVERGLEEIEDEGTCKEISERYAGVVGLVSSKQAKYDDVKSDLEDLEGKAELLIKIFGETKSFVEFKKRCTSEGLCVEKDGTPSRKELDQETLKVLFEHFSKKNETLKKRIDRKLDLLQILKAEKNRSVRLHFVKQKMTRLFKKKSSIFIDSVPQIQNVKKKLTKILGKCRSQISFASANREESVNSRLEKLCGKSKDKINNLKMKIKLMDMRKIRISGRRKSVESLKKIRCSPKQKIFLGFNKIPKNERSSVLAAMDPLKELRLRDGQTKEFSSKEQIKQKGVSKRIVELEEAVKRLESGKEKALSNGEREIQAEIEKFKEETKRRFEEMEETISNHLIVNRGSLELVRFSLTRRDKDDINGISEKIDDLKKIIEEQRRKIAGRLKKLGQNFSDFSVFPILEKEIVDGADKGSQFEREQMVKTTQILRKLKDAEKGVFRSLNRKTSSKFKKSFVSDHLERICDGFKAITKENLDGTWKKMEYKAGKKFKRFCKEVQVRFRSTKVRQKIIAEQFSIVLKQMIKLVQKKQRFKDNFTKSKMQYNKAVFLDVRKYLKDIRVRLLLAPDNETMEKRVESLEKVQRVFVKYVSDLKRIGIGGSSSPTHKYTKSYTRLEKKHKGQVKNVIRENLEKHVLKEQKEFDYSFHETRKLAQKKKEELLNSSQDDLGSPFLNSLNQLSMSDLLHGEQN